MNKDKMYLVAIMIMVAGFSFVSCSKDDDGSISNPESVRDTLEIGGFIGEPVDLDLPSKTLWASHNVGAAKPSDVGAYICFTETGTPDQGYSHGIKTTGYDWEYLRYYTGKNWHGTFSKYVIPNDYNYGTIDNKTILDPEDDAATVNWGVEWCTPTITQYGELKDCCTWKWYGEGNTEYDGMPGYKVSSKTNKNSIFLPAAGMDYGKHSVNRKGKEGDYMASTLDSAYTDESCLLVFREDTVSLESYFRIFGESVRPVRVKRIYLQ